jgi:hypothetical protein
LPIWLLTIKSRESPRFPCVQVCRWHATNRWKDLNEGYNFTSDFTSIGGLHAKLCTSKVVGVSILGISGLPLGVPGQNDIWVLAPWLCTKNIIRGKVVVSHKSRSWWVLWVRVCLWFVCAQKMLQLCINQLVVWFV